MLKNLEKEIKPITGNEKLFKNTWEHMIPNEIKKEDIEKECIEISMNLFKRVWNLKRDIKEYIKDIERLDILEEKLKIKKERLEVQTI